MQPAFDPPSTLSRLAKGQWKRYVEAYDISDEHGRFLLQVAMEAFDRMTQAAALIKKHGPVAVDRFGGLRANPSVTHERDARAQMLAALKALHLDTEVVQQKPGRPNGDY